jgi:hypothetical protein
MDGPSVPAGLTRVELAEFELLGDGELFTRRSRAASQGYAGTTDPDPLLDKLALGVSSPVPILRQLATTRRERLDHRKTAIILHRLSSHAKYLPYQVVSSLVARCLPGLGGACEDDTRLDLAQVVVAHNDLLTDHPALWELLGSRLARARLLAAACLLNGDHDGPDVDHLLEQVHATVLALADKHPHDQP